MSGALDNLQTHPSGNRLNRRFHFVDRAERVARAMYEERRCFESREVLNAESRRVAGRMERIRKQQKSVSQTMILCRDHARLPASVGLSGEIQRNACNFLAEDFHSLTDSVAVTFARTARSAARPQLTKRQVPSQYGISVLAESLRDCDHQGTLRIAACSVG